MVECIGVILAFIMKWLRAGKTNKSRLYGFLGVFIVTSYWAIYFIYHNQYWLAFYNVVGFICAIRGVFNNRKGDYV